MNSCAKRLLIGLSSLVLVAGIFSTGCAKKAESQPAQKTVAKTEPSNDEDGYTKDRNRPVAVGSTQLHDDGSEELIIPLRERFFEDDPVMPRVKSIQE